MDLLRHLRHFVVVARELHFGRAAETLGMAQPPLSQSIQRLERELGVALFDRSQRQVGLTTAGQLLLGEADELLAGERRLRHLADRVRRGALGVLRAGVPPETPAVTLRALLDALAARAPGLALDLHELTSAEQHRMLADGRLDVGLLHHPVDGAGLRFGEPVDVPVGVLLPRASPLARPREIALADLAGMDLVTAPPATAPGWHEHLLTVCRQHGFAPARVRTARNPEFLFGLLLAGGAVVGLALYWTTLHEVGFALVFFCGVCMVLASLVLVTTGRRFWGAAVLQGALPLVGLILFVIAENE